MLLGWYCSWYKGTCCEFRGSIKLDGRVMFLGKRRDDLLEGLVVEIILGPARYLL